MMRTVAPLVLVAAAVIVVPGQAQAAPPLRVHAAKAYGKPVVYADRTTKVPLKVHIEGRKITDVDVAVARDGGKGYALAQNLKLASGTADNGVWQGDAILDKADFGGRYTLEVAVTDGTQADGDLHEFKTFKGMGPFTVYRSTKISVKAAPVSLRKGAKLVVKGRLLGLGRKKYQAMKRQPVVLLFRKKGAKKYVVVAKVRTNAGGYFSRTFKARMDGSVAAAYLGTNAWAKKGSRWVQINVL